MTSFASLSAARSAALLLGLAVVPWRAADAAPAELVERGHYLSNAGGCVECHTREGGAPFAGGLYMKTPFGSISTPNITPDRSTGIGAWTDEQFWRVMHDGIGHRGEYIYPVMPFPWYASVTREDVMAIRAYLAAQPAVEQARPPNKLSFPFSVRESLLAWRTAFFKPEPFRPDPAQTSQVNRGAYLVNGLAHCGECHNGQPVAGNSKFAGRLQGGVLDNWYAPNITSDVRDGIGGWTEAEIATFLKTGATPGKGIALGPMAQSVHSLSQLDDADLHAIAAYLKTTPAKPDGDAKAEGRRALYTGPDAVGGNAYLNFCASCHGTDGRGLAGAVTALRSNGAVLSKGPQNVISVVLGGLPAKGGLAPMLAIGAGMSDQDVADVANYVRQAWDHTAPATASPGMVAALRAEAATPMTAARPTDCAPVAPASLAKALADVRLGLGSRLAGITDDNMPQGASEVATGARRSAAGVARADLVNGLTAAYCRVVSADASLSASQKALRLGHFSETVYSALRGQLQVNR